MSRLSLSAYAAFVTLGAGFAAGCGGGGGGGADPADAAASVEASAPVEGSTIECRADGRADTYVANLAKSGASGALSFVLVKSDPGPPVKGTNTWTVKVMDAAGAAVTDATIDVKPFMPDHGHGTSAKATATANGDGTYTIEPLYLFMPGLWQVTLTVHAGTVTDSVVYAFCVEG